MIETEEFKATISKIGTGLWIYIPVEVINNLELQESDEVTVKLAFNVIQRYKCEICELEFDSDDSIPYCPACGSEETIVKINQ